MNEQWDPKDKTFLITGAASGLGAVYTEWFLKDGAKLRKTLISYMGGIAILDVAVNKGLELATKLNKIYHERTKFYKCDVGDESQLTNVFDQIVKDFGQVDVIINNAGIMNDAPTAWRESCDVNWQGLVSLTLKGVKHMRKDEGGAGGTIINVSSTAALLRLPFVPIYIGTKSAVLHFSQCLAIDPFHEITGVRILTFCLAPTDTPLSDKSVLEQKAWDEMAGKPLKALAETSLLMQKPESAADAIVKMFKEGVNGSIWISTSDKPAKDITSGVDAAFKILEELTT